MPTIRPRRMPFDMVARTTEDAGHQTLRVSGGICDRAIP